MSFHESYQERYQELEPAVRQVAFYEVAFDKLKGRFPEKSGLLNEILDDLGDTFSQDIINEWVSDTTDYVEDACKESGPLTFSDRLKAAIFKDKVPYVKGYYEHKDITKIPIYRVFDLDDKILVNTSAMTGLKPTFLEALSQIIEGVYYAFEEATVYTTNCNGK